MKTVIIDNKTPLEVSIQGLRIKPRLMGQRFEVTAPTRLATELTKAYGQRITLRLEDSTQEVEPVAMTLDALELSGSLIASLDKAGIDSIEALTALTKDELDAIKGVGKSSLEDILSRLEALGLSLKATETVND
jgi:DNA-directed RNA polymerase alpha subunit